MTTTQLEKFGIYPLKTKVNKNLYWCDILETEVFLPTLRKITPRIVIEAIYDKAYYKGVEEGKTTRSREFRKLAGL